MAGVDNPAYEKEHPVARMTVSSPSALPTLTVTNDCGEMIKNVPLPPSDDSGDPKVEDFDDVLPYVGEFGVYQVVLFFLTAPFCFFLAFAYFSQVFITLVPDHWCQVPGLNETGLTPSQM